MDRDLTDFVENNAREHESLRQAISNLQHSIEMGSMIRKGLKIAISIFSGVIIILLSAITIILADSRASGKKVLEAQEKTLEFQYYYARQLDSIGHQLNKDRTILYPVNDTLKYLMDNVKEFYSKEWESELKFTHEIYNNEIHPNTLRSIENTKRIVKIENKIR